jgi:AcrR family transcriptional regulator
VASVSTPSRRTQRERVEESSRRLAEAAIELIAEKGYSNTSAREIGVRAGYSRAMVAERFGSKEALLDAILEQQYERRIDVDVEPGASGLQRVVAPIEALRVFAVQDPQLLRAMFVLNFEALHDPDVLRQRIQSWLARLRHRLSDAVRVGQADGSISADVDADDIGGEIVATGIGYAYAWIVAPDEIDFELALKRWRDRLIHALRHS